MADLYQDLLKDTSESKENGNYFLLTITDLIPNTTYPIQFRYLYKDKTVNENWSAAKIITTPGESEPNTPNFTDGNVNVSEAEKIIITWDGTSDDASALSNYDRVDVYIDGLPFDGTKAAYSFKAPGTAIIPAPAGTYQIVLYAISKTGVRSPVSSPVTKTVSAAGTPVTDPEDPDTPTLKAGLASVIVSWSGKKSGGSDLTETGFAGARVYIGTTSGFTPSDNNWVHTLNFANGSNQVSIGVGTVIDTSTGATLAYGTPYYIKLGTVNASGATTGNYIAANPTNITVDKLPASEISTGILSADASITAGASSGARVVMSGGSSPFIIYGTNGTTKLLEFIGGSTGTLSINGGGTFTGNLSVGSSNAIFKAEPATGIWLGNAAYLSAPFSVSNNGVIKATAGTIGGWTLGSTFLQGTNIKLDTSGIVVGATTSSYFDISPTALTHRNANGTASGKFTLTLGATPQLTIDGNITINGSSAATASMLDSYATTTDLSTGLATKIGASQVDTNVTSISGGVIKTGVIDLDLVNIQNAATGARLQINSNGLYAYKLTSAPGVTPAVYTNTVFIGTNGDAFFKGDITGASGTFSGSLSGASITGATGTFSGALSAVTGSFSSGSIGGLSVSASSLTYGGLTIFTSESGFGLNYSLYDLGKGMRLKHLTVGDDSNNGTASYPLSSSSLNVFDKASFYNQVAVSGTSTFNNYIYYPGYGIGTGSALSLLSTSTPAWRVVIPSSSERFKDNIVTIDSSGYLDKINSLRPVTFTYKPEFSEMPDVVVAGLIAEELDDIEEFKTVVNYDPDGLPFTLAYDRLSVFLILAIKEISNKLNSIESRLDALEG